jgi:hypothetical protein
MTGYDVVTSDDHKIGTVIGTRDEYLIVEGGTLHKTRHALPKAFAHPVDAEQLIRVTVSKQLISESPRVTNGGFDQQAVARHYGLAPDYTERERTADADAPSTHEPMAVAQDPLSQPVSRW